MSQAQENNASPRLRSRSREAGQRSLVVHLSAIIATVLVAVLGIYALTLSSSSMRMLERQARADFASQTVTLRDMVAQFDDTLQEEADRFMQIYASMVPAPYSLDSVSTVPVAGQQTPEIRSRDLVLNANFEIPDNFFAISGGTVATVFARTGDDFVRVTTSLKKQDGSRAIGTLLDRKHPAYAALMAGQPYRGPAQLFGLSYMSKYIPMRDSAGQIIGALFVGVNISNEIKALKDRIRTRRMSTADEFMLIDASATPERGRLLAARQREGENLLDDKDADGNAWVRDMIDAGSGTVRHSISLGAGPATERLSAFATYPAWGWLIVGTVPMASLHDELVTSRNIFLGAGVVLALLLSLGFWLLLRRTISRPLAQAVNAAARIAQGDLTARLETRRRDEIGALMRAIDGISTGLSGIVNTVRSSASSIAASTGQIANGNADLSNRTSLQAGSLEATVASLEAISTTVRRNAEQARQASQAVHDAVQAAREGGATISRVVDNMAGIQGDAAQIESIIGIIDGIAFQTNILALNAAVESARAGEHGRGFAVVASEVRSLAQRSATAAAEIKALIERTVSNVDNGSGAVRQAGSAIDDLVSRVEGIASAMDSISTASTEQSEDIAQVQAAAAEMDRATQENAALVEEAAAAAAHLEQQTRDLQHVVERFRLAAGAGLSAASLPRAQDPHARLALET